MLPFQMKSKKSMMRMSRMSGRMQEIQRSVLPRATRMMSQPWDKRGLARR